MGDTQEFTIRFNTTNSAYILNVTTPSDLPFDISDIDVGMESLDDTPSKKGQPGSRYKNCAIVFNPFEKFTKHRFYNTMYLSSDKSVENDAKFLVFMHFKNYTSTIYFTNIMIE